jgi:hypothetical protein
MADPLVGLGCQVQEASSQIVNRVALEPSAGAMASNRYCPLDNPPQVTDQLGGLEDVPALDFTIWG